MKKLIALVGTVLLMCSGCSTTSTSMAASSGDQKSSVSSPKRDRAFNPNVLIHDVQFEVHSSGEKCLVFWDFHIENVTESKDIAVQPVIAVEKDTSTVHEYLSISVIPGNQIKFFSDTTLIDDCSKDRVKNVYLSDVIVQEVE